MTIFDMSVCLSCCVAVCGPVAAVRGPPVASDGDPAAALSEGLPAAAPAAAPALLQRLLGPGPGFAGGSGFLPRSAAESAAAAGAG